MQLSIIVSVSRGQVQLVWACDRQVRIYRNQENVVFTRPYSLIIAGQKLTIFAVETPS